MTGTEELRSEKSQSQDILKASSPFLLERDRCGIDIFFQLVCNKVIQLTQQVESAEISYSNSDGSPSPSMKGRKTDLSRRRLIIFISNSLLIYTPVRSTVR